MQLNKQGTTKNNRGFGGTSMNDQLNILWKRALELLRDEVSSISYETWILPIQPISIDTKAIQLGVNSDFFKNHIENKFKDLIKNTIKHITSRELEIEYILPGQNSENVSDKKDKNKDENSELNGLSLLNPKYNFETFVIGNGNRLAHAASVAVAESPAKAYNPLFLYGESGLGKTHLLHAIGNYIEQNHNLGKILYVGAEKFTIEIINAIKDDKTEEFRQKYRNIDVLMIDDIQFIGGKERTQEEFFHTFNALYEARKQIIITSDKTPKEINTLEERLRSRFEWGLMADIQPPDLETRIAILKKKAQQENIVLPEEIYIIIAEKITANIRKLEGALNRVVAYSTLTGSRITIENTEDILKDIFASGSDRQITGQLIIDSVARHFDIRNDDFKTIKRNREIAYPRQIAMFLCRMIADMSFPQIGDLMGGRDHTTVMHACRKIEDDMKKDMNLRRNIDELKRNITGK